MNALRAFREDWLGMIFAPRETFAALSARPAPRRAGFALLLLGASWAGLLAWLAADGRMPSFTRWLPAPPESYYRVASFYVAPLLLGLWLIGGQLMHILCGQRAPLAASLSVVGFALAVPFSVASVIPDLTVYGFNGHAALGEAVRITGPVTLLWAFGLTALGLRILHRLTRPQALRNTLILFLFLAAPAGILLR